MIIIIINYFRKKVFVLNVWQGPKYAFKSRMKIARYVNL